MYEGLVSRCRKQVYIHANVPQQKLASSPSMSYKYITNAVHFIQSVDEFLAKVITLQYNPVVMILIGRVWILHRLDHHQNSKLQMYFDEEPDVGKRI
jgi:hypothetical protein